MTQNEVKKVKEKILIYFGGVESIKSKYWTNSEKIEFENAISKSEEDSLAGLKYVLIAIAELNEKNKELITGIE